jgi:hypothetical protein
LDIDFGINNERLKCKTGTVYEDVLVGGRRVNEGDEGEGIWLMGFIYLYELEQ